MRARTETETGLDPDLTPRAVKLPLSKKQNIYRFVWRLVRPNFRNTVVVVVGSSPVLSRITLVLLLVLLLAPSLAKRQRWLILVHWSIVATTETDLQGGTVDNLSSCSSLEKQRRVMTGREAILVPHTHATARPKEAEVQYIRDTACWHSPSRAPSPCYFLLDAQAHL
jgi:hypothetical protein